MQRMDSNTQCVVNSLPYGVETITRIVDGASLSRSISISVAQCMPILGQNFGNNLLNQGRRRVSRSGPAQSNELALNPPPLPRTRAAQIALPHQASHSVRSVICVARRRQAYERCDM